MLLKQKGSLHWHSNLHQLDTGNWCIVYTDFEAPTIEEVIELYREHNRSLEGVELIACTFEEHEADVNAYYNSLPLVQIDEKRFNEMLEVLPPRDYHHGNGLTRFLMCEFTYGSFTTQFAHRTADNTYWEKTVNSLDKHTWISHEMIDAK
jgi:hypothetical protein